MFKTSFSLRPAASLRAGLSGAPKPGPFQPPGALVFSSAELSRAVCVPQIQQRSSPLVTSSSTRLNLQPRQTLSGGRISR